MAKESVLSKLKGYKRTFVVHSEANPYAAVAAMAIQMGRNSERGRFFRFSEALIPPAPRTDTPADPPESKQNELIANFTNDWAEYLYQHALPACGVKIRRKRSLNDDTLRYLNAYGRRIPAPKPGAALADDIRQCDGLVNMMSFWTFSDVFEEGGPGREPFDGSFGLIALGGIKKPSYPAFALLHKLGQERIEQDSPEVLVTRRPDGSLAIAAWNLMDPDKKGSGRSVEFEIRGVPPTSRVRLSRVDSEHGNTLAANKSMGCPRYPTQAQVRALNGVAEADTTQSLRLSKGSIKLELLVSGVCLLEVLNK